MVKCVAARRDGQRQGEKQRCKGRIHPERTGAGEPRARLVFLDVKSQRALVLGDRTVRQGHWQRQRPAASTCDVVFVVNCMFRHFCPQKKLCWLTLRSLQDHCQTHKQGRHKHQTRHFFEPPEAHCHIKVCIELSLQWAKRGARNTEPFFFFWKNMLWLPWSGRDQSRPCCALTGPLGAEPDTNVTIARVSASVSTPSVHALRPSTRKRWPTEGSAFVRMQGL